MKKENYVMLERVGDCGIMEWYAVIKNTTPQKALRWYEKEMDNELKEKIIRHEDAFYLENEEARAYEICLTKI